MYIKPIRQSGFTLIELSIVLVIIGLIIGGILVGRDLIRQAELRSLVSDEEKIKSAINTFRLKYNCLPGDCANATDFFGTASGGCPTGARSGTQTCNGNGDGDINVDAYQTNPADYSVQDNIEPFLFWQHMADANLWPGTYTGVSSCCSNFTVLAGTNVPRSGAFPKVGYTVMDASLPGDVDHRFYSADYSHVMWVGGSTQIYGLNLMPFLTGIEALNIDTKIDDGMPGSGSVLTEPDENFLISGVTAPCTTTNTPSTATYVTTGTTACVIVFGKMW